MFNVRHFGFLCLCFYVFMFYVMLPFKNKNYFTLDNLSKYGHITLKFVGRYFYLVVTIFSKKLGYFSPKIGGRKKLSTSNPNLQTKYKVPMAIKPEGDGGKP